MLRSVLSTGSAKKAFQCSRGAVASDPCRGIIRAPVGDLLVGNRQCPGEGLATCCHSDSADRIADAKYLQSPYPSDAGAESKLNSNPELGE